MLWLLTGIVLSLAWLLSAAIWVKEYHGWENLFLLAPYEQAMLVAGLLAPLGFLWSIVGLLFLAGRLAGLKRDLRGLASAAAPTPTKAPLETRDSAVNVPVAEPPLRVEPKAPEVPKAVAVSREIEPRLSAPLELEAPPRLSVVVDTSEKEKSEPLVPELKASPPKAVEPQLSVVPASDSRDPVASIAQEVAKALGRIQTPVAGQATPTAHSARAEFDAKVKRVSRDLNAISMDLSAILCRKDRRDEALKALNKGQRDAFHDLLRQYFANSERKEVMRRLVQSDSLTLLHSFAIKFGSLVDEAQKFDPAGQEEKTLEDSPMGRLYAEVQRLTTEPRGSAA